ncbi:MAG: TetR/AcrR family transcriptional regulator, partial [Candidatus Saccharibacteria bacterium]|nr:TetR/AcrR family transcriptional regulator [Pseudorhodobacter sp.]
MQPWVPVNGGRLPGSLLLSICQLTKGQCSAAGAQSGLILAFAGGRHSLGVACHCDACGAGGKRLNETGWRGSREAWLQAAYECLVESGVDNVRILVLAKKLSLSRTSFYWFFKDHDDLLAALVDLWRQKNTGNLLRQCNAYAETISEALLNVIDCWLDPDLFDARFEFSIRSWAIQSEDVAAEIRRADEERLAGMRDIFLRFGYESAEADVRARAFYLTQIGCIT